MAIDVEMMELRRQFNVLREQNEKLLGSIKVLRATNEDLSVKLEETREERDTYKKAFNEIFINNIGGAWENYDEAKKKAMSLDDKISFFNKELNLSKLYIRDVMEMRREEDKAKIETLETELRKLTKELETERVKKENAETIANSVGVGTTDPTLGKKVEEVKEKEENLGNRIASLIGGEKLKGAGFGLKDVGKQKSDNVAKDKPSTSPPTPKLQPETKKASDWVPKVPEQKEEAEETHNFFKKTFPNKTKEERNKMLLTARQIDAFLEKSLPLGREVLIIMGQSGEYTIKDIISYGLKEKIFEGDAGALYNKIATKTIKTLIERGLVKEFEESKEMVSSGFGRSAKNYGLTYVGVVWYAISEKTDPLISKYDILIREHKSPRHGKDIEMLKAILEEAGFECHSEESARTNTIGTKAIADIIAFKDGKKRWLEVEEGNYSTEDYIYKFKKVLDVERSFAVIVPTIKIQQHIKDVVDELKREYGGVDAFAKLGYGIDVYTLREVKAMPSIIFPREEAKTYNRR